MCIRDSDHNAYISYSKAHTKSYTINLGQRLLRSRIPRSSEGARRYLSLALANHGNKTGLRRSRSIHAKLPVLPTSYKALQRGPHEAARDIDRGRIGFVSKPQCKISHTKYYPYVQQHAHAKLDGWQDSTSLLLVSFLPDGTWDPKANPYFGT